jgi:hypothetical protein
VRVHTYVIATDAGSAPNYDRPFVTLAVCKPRIRKKAEIGDLVLAFAGKQVNPFEPHSVVWAGIVSEKMTFADYWNDRRFAGKKPDRSKHPDNFYRPVDGGLQWVPNDIHDVGAADHDTGGKYVLGFSRSWQFGAHGPLMPSEYGLRMVGGRRGERVVDLTDETWRRLKAWLDKNADGIKLDEPSGKRCKPQPRSPAPLSPLKPKRKC